MPGDAGSSCLTIESDGHIRILTLNRPGARNAVNQELHIELATVWSRLGDDPDARVVILTGAGGAFSAGGDRELIERTSQDAAFRYENMRQARRIVTEMVAFPLPVIAAVNGAAVGLGCSIAFLSDIVFAADTAFFADPHVNIGLVAADGGALCWPLLTSLVRAKEYLYTGERIDAALAEKFGMVNRVLPRDELMPGALELARRLAAQPQQALRDTKRAVNIHLSRAIGAVLDFAFSAEAETFAAPDFLTKLPARMVG